MNFTDWNDKQSLSYSAQYLWDAAQKEERARLMALIHERKVMWHKECLTDTFINGRFWEAQDIWVALRDMYKEK